MARTGRPPKPASLRVLEGNRGKRAIPSEPAADPGPCDPPAHLSAESRAVWIRIAPELEQKGLLAPRYLDLFEVFCDALVQYRRAARILNQTGPLVRGRAGDLVTNPAAREFARFGLRGSGLVVVTQVPAAFETRPTTGTTNSPSLGRAIWEGESAVVVGLDAELLHPASHARHARPTAPTRRCCATDETMASSPEALTRDPECVV